ncbi:MAG: DNA polymerase III subunit gamma/tau [bacterium]
MYLSLARKYRPKSFEAVIGQSHIVITLKNAISQNRINSSYLFFGPRGTGKTSIARILAKSLNCKEGPSPICCCKCSSCLEIDESFSLDVIEIDGASNRGIDQIRELRESVGYMPIAGRFKVYIIDEVHMLTTEAFNALLKTLEEPPSHVIFIFATTDVQKVPKTISSRTQMFEFRKIEKSVIEGALFSIVEKEGFKIDKEAISLISSISDGSLRDAESILDQVVLYKSDASSDDVRSLLGICKEASIVSLIEMIKNKDANTLSFVKEMIDEGFSPDMIIKGILDSLRGLIVKAASSSNGDIGWLIKAGDTFCETQERIRRLPDDAELLLELAIIKLIQESGGQGVRGSESQRVRGSESQRVRGSEGQNDDVLGRWNEVLEMVSKKNPLLKNPLREIESIETDEERLILKFKEKANTHRRIIGKAENKRIIEDVLYELFKRKIEVVIPERDIIEKAFEIFDAIEVR